MSEINNGPSFESDPSETEKDKSNEQFIDYVNEFISDRGIDKLIESVERFPNIEASPMSFEQIRKTVEHPGTITHVCRQEDVTDPQRIAPLKFWLRKGLGEAITHHHRFPTESSTSVNTTAWDGFNSSVEGGISWSLRDEKSQFHDLNLIVFSKEAVEKAAGKNFEPSDHVFLSLLDKYLLEKDVMQGTEFFNALDQLYGIKYIPPEHPENSPDWTRYQKIFALYERLCLMKSTNVWSFDKFYSQFKLDIEETSRYLKEEGKDFGFRYRGVYKIDDKKFWGPLETTSEDVSRVIIPAKPGESYLSLNFKDHPSL